jgi:DNA polymerase II large subunit
MSSKKNLLSMSEDCNKQYELSELIRAVSAVSVNQDNDSFALDA